MRGTSRLFAAVKPARYLVAGSPTGLTGVYTHSSPRSTLLYLYSRTLEKLQQFPESSLYRQSIEALTSHRMAIVESASPPGYEEWAAQARKIAQENPQHFSVTTSASSTRPAERAAVLQAESGGKLFIHRSDPNPEDDRYEEWDGEQDEGPNAEGLRGEEDRKNQGALFDRQPITPGKKIEWEREPQLTADQVEEIENKIGGGLIEEVVQRAENELRLVDIMQESKVWEDLEEKPTEGQWTYFER
ncbi:ETC complex I subunit conserved region-domain-containing protein [Hypoxylon rubiginosum]|uniref:ETC complex I subunit conserved region-domain-containing protein n=1 Tax=Hypoxylon rubiginosum TaxID=110542 RepID=A0ACC0DLX7_9PEZI|nr:ETC complex I subunit conserved region-domain-containing protein [Hypoxylon rubiginosum]